MSRLFHVYGVLLVIGGFCVGKPELVPLAASSWAVCLFGMLLLILQKLSEIHKALSSSSITAKPDIRIRGVDGGR